MLSEVTEGMFAEFNDLYKTFTESSYDPLDLSDDVSGIVLYPVFSACTSQHTKNACVLYFFVLIVVIS